MPEGTGWASVPATILVVEDELVIALELESLVEDLGHVVLGPAKSVEAALDRLAEATPDAALLDVNLRGEPVTAVAEECRDRGIPFILVTAYGRLDFTNSILQSAPRIRKPVDSRALQTALGSALGG